MNIKKLGIILFLIMACIAVTPVSAQTATFDSLTSPETVQAGEVVTIDIVMSYSCNELTRFSPGVYDPDLDMYIVEDFADVTGTGTESFSLSFNAPSVEGEYVYIVDLYYEDGVDWKSTGQSDYFITLTVTGGGSWSAVVRDVQYPSLVKPGGAMEIKITVEYDFPESTNMEVAVTNLDTYEAIDTASSVKNGAGTDEFKITINAPSEPGTYELGADVIFEKMNGWEFSDGGVMAFTFEVDESASSGGIPGFPVTSAVLGALVIIGLMYNGRKTPLI